MKTRYIICAFLCAGVLLSCGTAKTAVNPDDKLIGDWSVVAEATPQGDVPITMTIAKNEAGMFVGSLSSIMGDFAMSNILLKEGVMSCNFDVNGMAIDFKGVFTGDDFKGEVMIGQGGNFVTNGKRVVN